MNDVSANPGQTRKVCIKKKYIRRESGWQFILGRALGSCKHWIKEVKKKKWEGRKDVEPDGLLSGRTYMENGQQTWYQEDWVE